MVMHKDSVVRACTMIRGKSECSCFYNICCMCLRLLESGKGFGCFVWHTVSITVATTHMT